MSKKKARCYKTSTLKSQHGASIMEYAITAALIALVVSGGASFFGTGISTNYKTASLELGCVTESIEVKICNIVNGIKSCWADTIHTVCLLEHLDAPPGTEDKIS